jgi:uncharacterized protein YndB with AHSA1/START domain
MTTDHAADGLVRKTDDGYEIVFVRWLGKPIEKVWAALTIPERIADWFADLRFVPNLQLGARTELRFLEDAQSHEPIVGKVVAFDPPHVIAWTWDQGIMTFELVADGQGCRLTLTSRGPGRPHPNEMAGWHTHLVGLEGAADGVRTAWSADREKVHQARYVVAVAAL